MIYTKRVYDPPSPSDGKRFLVDRLWPRGVKKDDLKLDGWLKDAAPGEALRQDFAHRLAKWEEFARDYALELDEKPDVLKPILEAARNGDVTLLFAAKDREHNNAVVLKRYLERQLNGSCTSDDT
ncbi:MAG TPA: DUF488 family protein [Thermosynergistes sp.]|nr:DUF488 family protein [Thermosynergistes sp.]